ncbi:PREDICTED: RNA-binding protein CP33, chloroplastic [Nicotiana attenuata]|uniref:29 kDa ribonucleoprotein a, chloroplastic n=1 Tax=Nicotiana attenuata TaxID=49451 RepID=A0A1J6I1G2_NICAT|nr:PREDICTED: RNA-binding protein CP33, chloroplastic [Nicotiana attenuata]OIS98901.1 29 kda ribonucleoprotein a, chloroplastic [Nicotiana attenuata]
MAATAATAVASSFSTTLHSIRSKTWPNYNSDHLLKISSTRTPNITLVFSSSCEVTSVFKKWRVVPRLAAAVAQEEAAAVTVEEEEAEAVAVEEEVVVEEKGGEGSEESSSEGEGVNTKLYFGNLPYLCDSAQLAGIVQDYATPELVEVLYDRETGKSRGFAFVTMSSLEDCRTVIENLDGREYGGRTLRVNFSDKPKPKEPLYPETEHKLFVGNLAWSVTSESLAQAFQEYGTVVGARVLYDGETGRSRGYGFVSYENREQLENALQNLNGVELDGRAMRISLAQGKKQ